ncbi:hypothetical protein BGZ83_003047 [Gryganskiella cystojenkinii]|nr:hypothetical protein BGZ83_003047 [Gryganskiella cystojenkinii]
MSETICPLDLPEIRLNLSNFLSRSDLAICSRVSRSWQQSFEPQVWRDLSIIPTGYSKRLSLQTLNKHGASIQKLDCLGQTKSYLQNLNCPSLKNLKLPWLDREQLSFVCRHDTTLTDLSLSFAAEDYGKDALVHEFWTAVAGSPTSSFSSFPLLERLSLSGAHVTSEDWSACWSLWRRLTALCLDTFEFRLHTARAILDQTPMGLPQLQELMHTIHNSILHSDSFLEQLENSRIKELELRCVDGVPPTSSPSQGTILWMDKLKDQLALLTNFPDLETLIWFPSFHDNNNTASSNQGMVGRLVADATQHACPKIVHLTIGFDDPSVGEDEILPFLETKTIGTPSITKLTFEGDWFGDRSWQLLQQPSHHHHLSSLCVLRLQDIPSKMTQAMLCSLPNLQDFAAPWLIDVDLLDDPRPWVCVKLVRWAVCIDLTRTGRALQRLVFERLGSLRSLRSLDLSQPSDSEWRYRSMRNTQSISLKLGARGGDDAGGLELLKDLSQLEGLYFLDVPQELSQREILWMVEHWPNLQHVFGEFHPDDLVSETLRMLLEEKGVIGEKVQGVSIY